MRIVLTDAYSTSNVGDGELVRLTASAVLARYGDRPVVLATDPASFASEIDDVGAAYITKPLSRRSWRNRRGLARALWLARESAAIAAAAWIPFLPRRFRTRASASFNRLLRAPWFDAITNADLVVAVGGGYLGDKYLRESLVSLVCLRYALSLGSEVQTMPLSVSSADSALIRTALRFTRGVRYRSREAHTHQILRSLGLNSELVPDLAWLNAGEYAGSEGPREGIAIAPVGSVFYSVDAPVPKAWPIVEPLIEALPVAATVRLIAMHRWEDALGDGKDDIACTRFAEMIAEARPDLKVECIVPRTYGEVRRAMARSDLAICERLHAALAATTTGTPLFVIGYEPKHEGVMSLAGLAATCRAPGALSPPYEASEIMAAALRQRDQVREAVMPDAGLTRQ